MKKFYLLVLIFFVVGSLVAGIKKTDNGGDYIVSRYYTQCFNIIRDRLSPPISDDLEAVLDGVKIKVAKTLRRILPDGSYGEIIEDQDTLYAWSENGIIQLKYDTRLENNKWDEFLASSKDDHHFIHELFRVSEAVIGKPYDDDSYRISIGQLELNTYEQFKRLSSLSVGQKFWLDSSFVSVDCGLIILGIDRRIGLLEYGFWGDKCAINTHYIAQGIAAMDRYNKVLFILDEFKDADSIGLSTSLSAALTIDREGNLKIRRYTASSGLSFTYKKVSSSKVNASGASN